VNLKLAILRILAQHSERYLSIDEIKREVFKLGGRLEYAEDQFRLAGDDLFRADFISRNVYGWRITEAALSMLRSLRPAASVHSNLSSIPEPSLLGLLEEMDVIERSARWKNGTLQAFTETEGIDEGAPTPSAAGDSATTTDVGATDSPDHATAHSAAATDIAGAPTNPAVVSKVRSWLQKARSWLQGDGAPRLSSLVAPLASTKKTVLLRNLELRSVRKNIAFKAKAMARLAGRLTSFALLGLLACGVAVALLIQLSYFRRENAELQREVSRLRENFSKLEQTIKTEKNDDEKNSSAPSSLEPRIEQTAFQLSREEAQLIRYYIKPVPNFSASGPTVAVGDPIEGALVPLPSALVEKAPRLDGARFATRGGNIIIVSKGSNKVDAVLPTN
jgi:hypothetical protein